MSVPCHDTVNKPSLRHGEQTIATTRRAPVPTTRTAVCSGCHTQPGAAQQHLELQIPNSNLLLLLNHLQTGCQGVQDSGFSYELTPSSQPGLSVLETCRFTCFGAGEQTLSPNPRVK